MVMIQANGFYCMVSVLFDLYILIDQLLFCHHCITYNLIIFKNLLMHNLIISHSLSLHAYKNMVKLVPVSVVADTRSRVATTLGEAVVVAWCQCQCMLWTMYLTDLIFSY